MLFSTAVDFKEETVLTTSLTSEARAALKDSYFKVSPTHSYSITVTNYRNDVSFLSFKA